MRPVPFLPSLLGLLLILPFAYAAVALAGLVTPPRAYWGSPFAILNSYGAIYLAMLGGVYWGFAAKRANILDVLIALVPPFAALGASLTATPVLSYAIAISAMLVFDMVYISRGIAPKWWLSLRIYSGIIAVGTLVYAYYA
jgi:hypothetical protein